MHMSDALLNPAVAGCMTAVSAAALGAAAKKITEEHFDEKKIPLMGVMGAFVFAGQMINFTIPMTGSSGHIGGGILLAAVLGPFPALLTLAAVLLIQCLFFADGGLMALGCNIFNMAVCSCLIGYSLFFKPFLKNGITKQRLTLASVIGVVLSLQLGAFSVVLETTLSGITELPFQTFVLLMQPIHLAIGLVEGLVTAGVLNFLYQARPEVLDIARFGAVPADAALSSARGTSSGRKTYPFGAVLGVILACAVILSGAISLFASSHPDGLEWAIQKVAGVEALESPEDPVHSTAEQVVNGTAFLPDYAFPEGGGESAAGLIGTGLTLALVCGIGFLLCKGRRGNSAG